ncbi:hypothetical protein ACFL2Q_10500 [Thermodesulfobacteriota bacterium]
MSILLRCWMSVTASSISSYGACRSNVYLDRRHKTRRGGIIRTMQLNPPYHFFVFFSGDKHQSLAGGPLTRFSLFTPPMHFSSGSAVPQTVHAGATIARRFIAPVTGIRWRPDAFTPCLRLVTYHIACIQSAKGFLVCGNIMATVMVT